MSYGPNIDAIYRQLARFAVKLFNGTSVAEIPIGEPTKIRIGHQRRTANAIGIRLSPDVLMSADQIITTEAWLSRSAAMNNSPKVGS